MCNNCQQNNCGCSQTTTTYSNCNSCPPEPCSCPVIDLSTNCVLYDSDTLSCSGIEKNTPLTDVIQQLDAFICDATSNIGVTNLISVGTGAEIYKGIDGIGRREIKSVLDSNLINIIESANEITVSVNEEALTDFIEDIIPAVVTPNLQNILDVGGVASLTSSGNFGNFEMTNSNFIAEIGDSTKTNYIDISNSVVSIGSETADLSSTIRMEEGDFEIKKEITPSQFVQINIDDPLEGAVTYLHFPAKSPINDTNNYTIATLDDVPIISAGANITKTGAGTISDPFVISATDTNTTYSAGTAISLVGTTFNNTAPDQVVSLTQGGATTITGTYPNFTITSTDTNTTYSAGTGLSLTGTIFSIDNLQKVITYPADFTGTDYTLTNFDNNYEIIINNGATAVSITVPSGLLSKIGVGFTQKGVGDVTYVASGTTINNPIGLKIKGQYYQTYLSQEASTNIYYLGGNTKI